MVMPFISHPPGSSVRDPDGDLAGHRSLRLLWWIPLSPIVGFLFAEVLLSETWPLWQVVPLTIMLAGPFAVGAFYGLIAVRHGNRLGWIGLVVHLAFLVLAVVMPISESLTA